MVYKLNRKKLVFSLLFSIILCSFLLGYQYALSSVPSSGPYYLDIPFGTASFYVGKFDNGSTYMVNGDTWQCTWNNPDSDVVINAVLGNLTSERTHMEKVVLKGDFTIDAPILVSSYTHLVLIGNVALADNSNCNMIQNAHPETSDQNVIIEGGRWYGNNAAQSSGDIIHWNNTSPVYNGAVYFRDLRLIAYKDNGLFVKKTPLTRIEHCQFHSHTGLATGWGLHLIDSSDSIIHDIIQVDEMCIEQSSMVLVNQVYVNGHLYVKAQGTSLHFVDVHVDTDGSVGDAPIVLEAINSCIFNGITVRLIGDGPAIARAILLKTMVRHSTNNTFNCVYMGRMIGIGTKQFIYGIEETNSNQDYNIYSTINGGDCVTGALRVLGSNSRYDSNSTIGTIVTS